MAVHQNTTTGAGAWYGQAVVAVAASITTARNARSSNPHRNTFSHLFCTDSPGRSPYRVREFARSDKYISLPSGPSHPAYYTTHRITGFHAFVASPLQE